MGKQQLQYKIGDWVEISAYYETDYTRELKTEWRYTRKRIVTKKSIQVNNKRGIVKGQVTGLKKIQLGNKVWLGDDGGWSFEVDSCIEFWEVKLGLLNKPLLVKEEDMAKCIIHDELPKLFQQCWLNVSNKDLLSKDSKHWIRDKKGRWTGESK